MSATFLNPQSLKHRSDVVIHNNLAYLSGALSMDSRLSIADQSRAALSDIDARLQAAGTSRSNILSATIYLSDVDGDVAAFNEIWSGWLVPGREPARTCVQAHLQFGARVEVTVVAFIES